jgi:hypothetical protein
MLASGERQRIKSSRLSLSEVMTIIVMFHSSSYRNFKDYYLHHISKYYHQEFPGLVSYTRFVELQAKALLPLCYLMLCIKGQCSGIAFIDSLMIAVCHNRRINSHKVFAGVAKRGKSSVGFFYGFKLHLVINDVGQILAFRLTPANVSDRVPVPALTKDLFGKLIGDRGYISSQLFELLFEQGLQLITKIRKNMKNKLMPMPMLDKILLRKRAIIESVNDQLKNISQIEHSRHRSLANFLVNIIAALLAYSFKDRKPSLNIRFNHLAFVA